MFATILIHVPVILLSSLLLPAPVADRQLDASTPIAAEGDALARFDAAVEHYVTLHRRLERWLPPEHLFEDADDMFAARDALRSAILEARPNARQGDIFTPDVAQLLIDRLDLVIREQGYGPADILANINEGRLPGVPAPEVNRPYPWAIASSMWPGLLRALPLLPPELEYRFSNRDLVLIDIHANLVLDILEGALPAGDHEIVSGLDLRLAESFTDTAVAGHGWSQVTPRLPRPMGRGFFPALRDHAQSGRVLTRR